MLPQGGSGYRVAMSASPSAGEPVPGADVVRAAGGVVWRPGPAGEPEVALVHRPAYDDWTFPKGKLLDGEEDEAGALREVMEETGLICRLGEYLGSLSYRDRKDRPKTVRYWAMKPVEGSFVPNAEVDAIRWLSVGDAAGVLTYGHDRGLLVTLAERTSPAGTEEAGSEVRRPAGGAAAP
jgi:8-oxo-dGTP diphosphatase